jgi:hypothetical protein
MGKFSEQEIINFIMSINWSYLAWVGSAIVGATISASISYIFTKKRENQRLRIDLQAKATDQLLESIKVFIDASSGMFIPGISFFDSFNTTFRNFPLWEAISEGNSGIISEEGKINKRQVEQAKKNIFDTMNSYLDLWGTYTKSFISIISILESKEVIFNKFVGFRYLLLDEFNKLNDIHNDITSLYNLEIRPDLINSMPIKESQLARLHEYEDKFMEKRADITAIMWDLRVGVQNEFLSKLFKYKVKLRQPTVEGYQVYKTGYIHEEDSN